MLFVARTAVGERFPFGLPCALPNLSPLGITVTVVSCTRLLPEKEDDFVFIRLRYSLTDYIKAVSKSTQQYNNHDVMNDDEEITQPKNQGRSANGDGSDGRTVQTNICPEEQRPQVPYLT